MGADYHDDSGPDVPEEYIHQNDVLEWVFDNERDAVEKTVKADAAADWLSRGKSWLELLNIVSRHDKEQLREAIKRDVTGTRTSSSELIEESQLFAVASDAARLLESVGSPYAESCSPSTDLTWSNALIKLTRAFREILFLMSEPEGSWMVRHHLRKPLEEINSALVSGRPARLAWQMPDPKSPEFLRMVDPESTPLHSHIAEWICEFLVVHFSSLGLSVCAECGTIFVRERRDNVYCSKACQNRIAYKRRKIFESGVLVQEIVDPSAPSELTPGMWVSHPRLGLGRVEAVRFTDRKLWVQFEDHGFSERIHEGSSAEEQLAKLKEARQVDPAKWEEIVDPRSIEVRVRFLQLARSFRSWEIFPNKKDTDSIPTFYRVADAATLADLL